MVKGWGVLIVLIWCAIGTVQAQVSQRYAALGDSSVALSSTQWLNQRYIYGRYSSGYGPVQKLKLGQMFTISGDSVTVTTGGSGDVNQGGNSYGATMSIGTNDNQQFRIRTNGVERFSLTTGSSTGGLISQTYISSTTNAVVDAYTINASSTGTVANNFGSGFRFTASNASGLNKDLAYISPYWVSATNSSEISAIKFRTQVYGSIITAGEFTSSNSGGGTLKIDPGLYPLSIDGLNFSPNLGYTFGPSSYSWEINTGLTNNAAAILLKTTGAGGGTTVNAGTQSATNPTSNTFLSVTGSVTASGAGSNNYTGLMLNNTFTESGGHAGITRGLYVNDVPNSSINDYRAVDIATQYGKGVYQSNTSIQNNLAGKTNIGSTGDPIVKLKVTGRFAAAKGANVASANNMSLGQDGNSFTITGSTTINTIDATSWIAGSVIYLIFSASCTVAHNTAGTGARLFLAGSVNMAAVANSTLTLIYDGSVWQEISRKTP